jgi:hypothetical protein
MSRIFLICKLILSLLFSLNCTKALDAKYQRNNRFNYFVDQLENLHRFGLDSSELYQYGKFDSETASLILYDVNTWEAKKVFRFKPYKDDVFFVDGYDKFFLYLGTQDLNGIEFIKDKDNVKSYITNGGALDELSTLEDCKEHAKRVKKEFEDAQQCDGCQGPM